MTLTQLPTVVAFQAGRRLVRYDVRGPRGDLLSVGRATAFEGLLPYVRDHHQGANALLAAAEANLGLRLAVLDG